MSDIFAIEQEAKRLLAKLGNTTNFRTGFKYDLASCLKLAPLTLKINQLKKEKDFFILAHYYTSPEIIYGVADATGDSYALSLKATDVASQNIIFAGVRFMAETAHIINPYKNVFNSAFNAGCSLADSIDAAQVTQIKEKYPNAAFVCYINSTAAVKALCDICVTSSNVYDIISALPQNQIVFLPDIYMADNIRAELGRRGIQKEVLSFGKTCCVHDKYAAQDVSEARMHYPAAKIIAHPECPASVCALCDFVGSTAAMLKYVRESPVQDFIVLSETGIVNCMQVQNPTKNFLPYATPCTQMKKNNLENILNVIVTQDELYKVMVDADIIAAAAKSINNMFKLTEHK